MWEEEEEEDGVYNGPLFLLLPFAAAIDTSVSKKREEEEDLKEAKDTFILAIPLSSSYFVRRGSTKTGICQMPITLFP